MRRLRIVNKARFITSMTVIIMFLVLIFSFTSAKENVVYEDYIVTSGETLWTIATENKKADEDIREYIYELQQINNIDDCMIYPNQIIKIIK